MKSIPKDDPHDFGPTEKELAHVLAYMRTLSCYLARCDAHTPGTASLEEYQDRGMEALVYAWQIWDGQRGIPFHAFSKHVCKLRMRQATSKYQTWALPGSHCLPDADHLTCPVAYGRDGDRELTCAPPESLAWFYRDLTQHWPCLSPCMQQTLRDTLDGLSTEEIAARDHVSLQTKHNRYAALVTCLRRHIYDRSTTCEEEVQAWQHGTHTRVDPAARQAKQRATKARWVAANRERHLAQRRSWRQARKVGAALAAAD